LAASSVRQLYRGLGMGVATNSIVFVLSLLTVRRPDPGSR